MQSRWHQWLRNPFLPILKHRPFLLGVVPTLLVVTVYLSSILFPRNSVWVLPRLDSIVDDLKGYLAISLGILLVLLRKYREDTDFAPLSYASAGLIFVGISKLYSASTENIPMVLWLRAVSRIGGAVFFAMAWMPSLHFGKGSRLGWLPLLSLALAIGSGFLVWRSWQRLPYPVIGLTFTTPYVASNVIAGGLYLFGIYRGGKTVTLTNKDYAPALISIEIFWATTCLLVPFTSLWSPRWWMTHFLGFFPFVVAFGFCLSAYCRLQEELISTRRLLKQSNENLREFAYVASHDLKEPLRTVSSYLTLLDRHHQGKWDAESSQFLTFAQSGVRRMQAYISDLLEYSRLKFEVSSPKLIDCVEVIEEAKQNLHRSLSESGAEIHCCKTPSVMANKSHLLLLFQNLFSNSLKYRGDKTPVISIETKSQNSEWVFTVTDNGIGFEPSQKEKIFEMFYRAHGKHAYPGSGIGLASCKRIVEGWGGRIWADGKPGKGSSFSFTVPANLVRFTEKPA